MQKCTTTYEYDFKGRLLIDKRVYEYNDGATITRKLEFLYEESDIVGVIFTNSDGAATYYYDKNPRGDVIAILDNSGNTVVKYTYDAYGNCNCTYSYNTDLANSNPIRYRSYYYDEDTGLYYLNARYYNPQWRRFISPDDTAYIDIESVNGLNLYCYANNNPIGIAQSSFNVGNAAATRNSSNLNASRFYLNQYSPIGVGSVDPNIIGNIFDFNENVYSLGAGIVEVVRSNYGYKQLSSLKEISNAFLIAGAFVDMGLNIYNNFSDNGLSRKEQWVSFAVDTVHTAGQTIGSFFLGGVPYVGPFLAIIVPIGIDYLWSGELCVFGLDINVSPIIIYDKTFEEWFKYCIYSLIE